ncbi:Regulator of sirC expression [Parelusimicrobium proximum]|uniref:transglutaminase family protein n=1 Tax=Parelusimicrobium proximum TaxID=3228953 RepID=UPI003D174943
MKEHQIRALIQLITKENDETREELKKELSNAILFHPDEVRSALEQHTGETPLFVKHAMEEIVWENLRKSFSVFATKINPDLEEGLMLISKFMDPALSEPEASRRLDEIALILRQDMINCIDVFEIAQAMQNTFFGKLRFTTVSAGLRPIDVSFYNLLKDGRGSATAISCLYALLGQRYSLDINIVNMHGRIMLHFIEPAYDSHFFADPLDKGKIISEEECRVYLADKGIHWSKDFLLPLNSKAVVKRALANLIYLYNKQKDDRRLNFLRDYISYLEN